MAKTGFEVFDTHWFLVNDLEMGFIFLLISNNPYLARRPFWKNRNSHSCLPKIFFKAWTRGRGKYAI